MEWFKKRFGGEGANSPASSAVEPAAKSQKDEDDALPNPSFARQTATGTLDGDHALDTVVALLRIFGAQAFDTNDCDRWKLREQCDHWAGRIAMGASRGETESRPFRRDWPGLLAFFERRREEEASYVHDTLNGLRGAIGDFAHCLGAAIVEEREHDQRIESELSQLNSALTSSDLQRIRACTSRVVSVVSSALGKRRNREEQQLKRLAKRLQSLTSELSEAREQAALDPLTGVYNRGAFDRQLLRLSELGMFYVSPPILILVDVDRFKAINDRHGHPAGDAVLKQLGDTLLRTFLRKQDFVCRYGGEEFAILLLETSLDSAQRLAHRVLTAVRAMHAEYAGVQLAITVSLGAAVLKTGESAPAWLTRADKALYAAKEAGRARIVFGE